MRRFEYHILKEDVSGAWIFDPGGKVDESTLNQKLNALGHVGWELVSSFDTSKADGRSRNIVLIFKRELAS